MYMQVQHRIMQTQWRSALNDQHMLRVMQVGDASTHAHCRLNSTTLIVSPEGFRESVRVRAHNCNCSCSCMPGYAKKQGFSAFHHVLLWSAAAATALAANLPMCLLPSYTYRCRWLACYLGMQPCVRAWWRWVP